MQAAEKAVDVLMSKTRRQAAALARPPRIPARKRSNAEPPPKRAAIVLRRGMIEAEFRRIERLFESLGLNALPVFAGQRRGGLAETPLCGLVITGSNMQPSQPEQDVIGVCVEAARARGVPVLGLSEGAALVLHALADDERSQVGVGEAVLIGEEVQALRTEGEVERAVKMMAHAPMR